MWESVPLLAVAGLQWYAYAGILDQAGQTRKAGDTSLVGGSNLDLLVVTLLVQYGAVLWTSKVYYLLLMVPVWGAYALYSTFFGGGNKKSGTSPSSTESSPQESDPAVLDKRQKRADKRRQKWS